MYTSSDDADDGYYDNYISRGLCGTGPVNQQDFTIQDAINIGLRPFCWPEGHCWICPLGCLYVPRSHPDREKIQEELLLFANKGTHPIYINLPFFELSPMKIHALKSLSSSEKMVEAGYGIQDIVNDIIEILETLSMNHLPHKVKMFVKNCDITAYQYQRTLTGAPDSMSGFRGEVHFGNMRIENYESNPEWKGWIARQHKIEPESAVATHTSLDNEDGFVDKCIPSVVPAATTYMSFDAVQDRHDDNYISRALFRGTGPVTQSDFTIQDAVNIGLQPNYNSNGKGCFICPLGCLYVPDHHPQKEEFHEALLTIANKGSHPIYVNLPFFELSPSKIGTMKSMYNEENTDFIIDVLHCISLNHLPHEVETFVRNCNTTKYQHKWTLIGSSDCVRVPLIGYRDNLDFFLELSLEPLALKGWRAKIQEVFDGCSGSDKWDHQLQMRLIYGLGKDDVNYNNYNPFDSSNCPKHETVEPEPVVTYTSLHHQHANELQQLLDQLTAKDDHNLSDPSQQRWLDHNLSDPSQQRWLESMLQKGLNAYAEDNDYDPFSVFDHPQQPSKQKAPPTTCRPRRPPKFISCPNGILFRVLSLNDSKKILDTSRTDLENILLSQGQFCSRRLLQMSTLFTQDAREQALLQGPRALEFVKTLHRLYCRLSGVLNPPSHTATPEVWIENRYIYKQQQDYLCFDCDFDNNDDDDDDIPTTAAADLLLSLINQVPATSSPPPPTPLSQFNFSYIDVTPPRTAPSPFDDSDIVPSNPISCDKDSTATLSTTSLERTTSYSLLSSHLLVPSQFIKLSYGDEQYCTVLTSQQRPVPLSAIISHHSLNHKIDEEMRRGTDGINRCDYHLFSPPYTLTYLQSSTIQYKKLWLEEVRLARMVYVEPDDDVTQFFQGSCVDKQDHPITETFIPSLRAAPSRSVSFDEASNYPYSFLSSVEVGVMIIIIMIILPTILTTILTILPMMLLLLPTVTLTNEELAISPNTKTTITTTVSTTFPSDATSAPTFSHDPGKCKELRLQRQHFWAFIQKLHYSRIGSSGSGFQWITAILYKLSMTIWTLWQFHNDGVRSSSSAWQLLLGVLH